MKKVNREGRMSSLNISKRGINMKKTLIVLLTAVLALSMLFVSCSNEAKIDEKVNVSFGVSQGRSLSSSASFAEFSDFDWWYKATTSSTDFNYGQRTEWTKLRDGLATNLELSQGIWDFELCAVAKNTESIVENQPSGNTVKAYYGSRTGVLIEKAGNGNAVTIAISVTPGSTGNGTIIISKDIIVNKRNGETSTIVANNYEIKVKDSDTVSYSGTISNEDVSQIVAAGNYTVIVYYTEEYTGATGGYILRATEPIDVTVYDSSTITVEGSIHEATQAIIINPVNKYKVEASTTATTTDGSFQNVAVTAPMTPAMSSSASNNTVVTVPAAIISAKAGESATSATVKVAVEVTPITEASVNDEFKISSGNTAAAAIDLTLYVNDTEVTDYSEAEDAPLLTVETYVAKNLSDVKVSYNGVVLTDYEYEATTGYLKFTTTHFSTFVVESSSKALIDDKAYDSLSDAVANSTNGDVVTLIADAYMDSSLIINGGKHLTIDLNGFDISAPEKVIQITHANVTLTGKGTVYERVNNSYGALVVKGAGSDEGANYTVVTVGENVTLRGWSGIFVGKDEAGTYLNYGLVVNLYGKVMIPGMDDHATRDGAGIYLNGQNVNTEGNVPVFNIEGASVKGNGGIYAAGYAEWNISDSDLEGNESAIEIRAGRLNINSGSFVAINTPTSSEGNGSGSTTSGAAIAVAQHTTKLPIDVTISNGTFEGYSAFYESNPQHNSDTDIANVSLSITGGTFNAINGGTCAVYSQDKTEFISGGTFTSDPSSYVASGYEAIESEGQWIVSRKVLAKIGDNSYYTLEEAIAAATDGATIILTSDIEKTVSSVNGSCYAIENKSITIDGQKHVLTLTGSFENDKDEGTEAYGIKISGTVSNNVTLQNMEIKTSNIQRAVRTEGEIGITIDHCAILTNGCGIHVKGANKAEIKNSTLTVNVDGNKKFSAHLRTAVMVGGKNADVTLTGCTINASNLDKTEDTLTWCKGLYVGAGSENAKITAKNTTVTADYSIAIDGSKLEKNPTQIVIESGTYTGVIGTPGGYSYKSLTINDGTFLGLTNLDSFYGKDNKIAKLVISGGTFPFNPDTKYISDGCKSTANENGTWTVTQDSSN